MNTTLPEYKTVQEAADLLRVSKKQVHKWIRGGRKFRRAGHAFFDDKKHHWPLASHQCGAVIYSVKGGQFQMSEDKITRRTVDLPDSYWDFLAKLAKDEAEEGDRPSVNRALRRTIRKAHGEELEQFKQSRTAAATA